MGLTKGDCIIVNSGANEPSYIGMITDLWSDNSFVNTDLKITVCWYYRSKDILECVPDMKNNPAHVDHPAAIYASKHYDSISAACVDDKCYVLTINEYSLYRKRCKLLSGKLTTHNQVYSKGENFDLLSVVKNKERDVNVVVDAEELELHSAMKVQPRPRRSGANCGSVFFCPGMWDINTKKITT